MRRARQSWSQKGDTEPAINSALLLGVPQKGLPLWPPGPELLCSWEQGCPASLSAEQSVLGNVSPGLSLPICHRGSYRWKLPHRRAAKQAVGKRGQLGAPRNTPYYLTNAQPSALSPGLWIQAPWGLSGERPKPGGTGRSWEKSRRSPWPSLVGEELRPGSPGGIGFIQRWGLPTAASGEGLPGPQARLGYPPA